MKGKALKIRTLMLLADNQVLARQLEQALAVYHLSHNLKWFKDLADYRNQVLTHPECQDSDEVDLMLLAYPGDAERTYSEIQEIRHISRWRLVPMVVFLEHHQMPAAKLCYKFGANSVLSYPLGFDAIRQIVSIMDKYWFNIVELPSDVGDH